jgi:hypothetical protein
MNWSSAGATAQRRTPMAATRSPPSPAQRLVTRTTAAANIAHQGSRPMERTRSLTPKSAKNGETTIDSSEPM